MAFGLLPLAFGGAFLVGEGLSALLGYPPGGNDPAPWWVIVLSTLPAFAVFAIPAIVATHFARRAAANGDARGKRPARILQVVTAAFVLMNLLAPLVG